MRTRQSVHVLSGHSNTVSAVLVQDAEPQVITASMDSSIRLWVIIFFGAWLFAGYID